MFTLKILDENTRFQSNHYDQLPANNTPFSEFINSFNNEFQDEKSFIDSLQNLNPSILKEE